MKTHLVFIIQGYELKTENGGLEDACEIQLIDKSVTSAMDRAKKIVKKKAYRLSMVIEKEE